MGLSPDVVAALREAGKKTGRLGGLARAKNMTAKQRRESALKASRAAAKARSLRAKRIEKSLAGIEKTGKKMDALTAKRRKKE